MRRALSLLVLCAVALALCWYLAALPGQVEASFGAYRYSASVPVTILLLIVLFGALYILLRLAEGAMHLPRRLRRRRRDKQRRLGDIAVTQALLALAAGDGPAARQAAAQARRMLGAQPQTLLLMAQAARASGFEEEATDAFRTLSLRDDAAFLGLRGLLRQAIAREDWPEAAQLARRAEEAHPGAAWLRAERARLALRRGAWKEALQLSSSQHSQASMTSALATAASEQEENLAEARRLAKQGFEADPASTTAALNYARRLRDDGRMSRTEDVLRRAWIANPHPAIGAAYVAETPDKLERVQLAKRLANTTPDHLEASLLLARVSLDAGLLGEARRYAEAARASGCRQKRLFVLLAEIAAKDPNEAGQMAQHDALRRAADAEPDPVWRCDACGSVQDQWHPSCTICHETGQIRWTSTPARTI